MAIGTKSVGFYSVGRGQRRKGPGAVDPGKGDLSLASRPNL